MAPLTWRNVEAPDFRGALDGMRVASNALDRAVGGMSDGLSKFREYRQQEAESLALNNALRFSDPAAYRAALASGEITAGIDPSLIGARTIQALDNRAASLLEQAGRQQQIAFDEKANPFRLLGLNLANQTTQQQLDYAAKANPLRLQELGTNVERGQWALRNDQQSYTDTQAGTAAAAEAVRNATSPEDIAANLERMSLSPAARAIAMASVGRFGNVPGFAGAAGGAPMAGGSGSTLSSSAPGTQGTRQGSPYDTTFRYTPTSIPVTSMSIGQVLDLQNALRQQTGSSPVGAFQINRDTLLDFAPRVLGSNWREQVLTPENQEKIAKAIFEARKQGDLTQTWAALPNKEKGAYANQTWEQVRNEIARRETGLDIPDFSEEQKSLGNRASAAITNAQARINQDMGSGISGNYAEAFRKTDYTVDDAVREIREGARTTGQGQNRTSTGGGSYSNVPGDVIRQTIQEIMARGNVNAAVAKELLDRYGSRITYNRFGFGDTPNGIALNEAGLNDEIARIRRGDVFKDNQISGGTAAIAQAVQTAQASYAQALQEYRAALASVDAVPGRAANLPRYANKLNQAAKVLQDVLGRLEAVPSARPIWEPSAGQRMAQTEGSRPVSAAPAFSRSNPSRPQPQAMPEEPDTEAAKALDAARSAMRQHISAQPGQRQRRDDPEAYAEWRQRQQELADELAQAERAYRQSLPDSARFAFPR